MDRLAVGSDNLWGGVVGPDDNQSGLYECGPQAAKATWTRIIKTPAVDEVTRENRLPPPLAQMTLTMQGRLEQRLQRMLARARIQVTVAQQPVETYVKRRLQPIKVGR